MKSLLGILHLVNLVSQYAQYLKKNKDLKFPSASVLAGDKKPSIRKGQRNKLDYRLKINKL